MHAEVYTSKLAGRVTPASSLTQNCRCSVKRVQQQHLAQPFDFSLRGASHSPHCPMPLLGRHLMALARLAPLSTYLRVRSNHKHLCCSRCMCYQ